MIKHKIISNIICILFELVFFLCIIYPRTSIDVKLVAILLFVFIMCVHQYIISAEEEDDTILIRK